MNDYEWEARDRKAQAIALHILAQDGAKECDPDLLLAMLEEVPEAGRTQIANMAGQHPPSHTTWSLVTRIVATALTKEGQS